jgi:hypothetical protein
MIYKDTSKLQDELVGRLEPVYSCWKEFLLGRREHPDCHEIHVFPVDTIQGGSLPSDPGRINTYFVRGTDMDLVSSPERGYVYAHIPYFLLFGRIYDLRPRFQRCSRIRVRKGQIGGKYSKYTISGDIMNYLYTRARFVRDQAKSMSARQWDKIEATILRDPDRLLNSPAFEAGLRDHIADQGKESL